MITSDEQRQKQREQMRKWRAANPEKARTYSREYARKYLAIHKDRINKQRRAIYSSNPEPKRARDREYKKNHPYIDKQRNLRKYGLTISQFNEILLKQGGVCAICGSDTPNHKKGWAVDHCHNTNKVRGILCYGCNVGLGHFKDDIEKLLNAVSYLEDNNECPRFD